MQTPSAVWASTLAALLAGRLVRLAAVYSVAFSLHSTIHVRRFTTWLDLEGGRSVVKVHGTMLWVLYQVRSVLALLVGSLLVVLALLLALLWVLYSAARPKEWDKRADEKPSTPPP